MEKVRSAGQEVSAQLGGHVSSSTLSAHQMARAGEPVDSDGSIEWVLMRPPDIDKSYYWNRRTNSTAWDPPAGVEVVWVGEMSAARFCGTGTRSHCAYTPSAASWVTGCGVRGLASPHPFLGATPLA